MRNIILFKKGSCNDDITHYQTEYVSVAITEAKS